MFTATAHAYRILSPQADAHYMIQTHQGFPQEIGNHTACWSEQGTMIQAAVGSG